MTGKIYYYCPENRQPTGGNKIVYRHVELLAELGYNSHVLHATDGFRYQQFSHRASIVYSSGLALSRGDVLVLPEDVGPALAGLAPGIGKIIFNQNAYYSFLGFNDLSGPLPPYREPGFIGVLTVSEDSKSYLEFAFPGLRCSRVRLSCDRNVFNFPRPELKRRQICFMTRKNLPEWLQVIQILRSRGSLRGWKLQPITGLPEVDVARVMAESAIYLSFGYPEGFGLSSLEAVSCGCRVVGYAGMGGREYFEPLGCLEVPQGDIQAFVQMVEQEILLWEKEPGKVIIETRAAAMAVTTLYPSEAEASDLDDFFNPVVRSLQQ